MKYAVERASEALLRGGVIVYPTDTIYGFGALYNNEVALKKIIALKGRPETKGILLRVRDMESLRFLTEEIPDKALSLAERFWPGPLTIVFKAKAGLFDLITGGTGKVAVRIPGESFALELLRSTGLIITSTSVNPSGLPPAEDVETVKRYFGNSPDLIDLVIDGGRLSGPPSTIVEIINGKIEILREGIIKADQLNGK